MSDHLLLILWLIIWFGFVGPVLYWAIRRIT